MIEPPYRTVAVASTFSPRFLQVLAEGKRVRDRLCQQLHLIYVGQRDEETKQKFASAFRELELPEDSAIHYHQGEIRPPRSWKQSRRTRSICWWRVLWRKRSSCGRSSETSPGRCVRKAGCFRHAFYQAGERAEAAGPDRFPGRVLGSRPGGAAQGVATGGARAMRKTFRDPRLHDLRRSAGKGANRPAGDRRRRRRARSKKRRSRSRSSSTRRARPRCPSRRVAFAATPVMPRSISSNRSTPRCWRCRSIPLLAVKTGCPRTSPGSPT